MTNDPYCDALEALAKRICSSPFADTRDAAPEALDSEMIEIVDDARAALARKEGK